MKKLFLSLLALIWMSGIASAQSVAVDDVEAVRGETVTASLNFSCPANIYSGMKIKVSFPSEKFTITEITASEGQIGTNDVLPLDKEVTVTQSVTNTFDAVTINVVFTVGSDVELSEEGYEVTVSGQLEGEEGTTPVYTPVSTSFKVKVINAHNVTLSEDAEEAPAAAKGVNAVVQRTITGGNWSTICLPFAISEDKLAAVFGEGVQVKDFKGYDYDGENIKVKFSTVTAMEANHPYIIKVASDINEFTVEGVDINPAEDPRISLGEDEDNFKDFVGTYSVIDNLAKEAIGTPLFLSENKFWYAAGKTASTKTTMKAFRAYFDFVDEAAEARIGMVLDEETGITNVVYQNDGEFYNLRGQRVETPSKGVFIKDGKKIVVK